MSATVYSDKYVYMYMYMQHGMKHLHVIVAFLY